MITKTRIEEKNRSQFLPKYIGNPFLKFEMYVYGFMERFAEEYQGGYWEFFELSNGGMFICPQSDKKFRMINPMNHSDEVMTAEAAGIGVSLYALNALAFETSIPKLGTLYYALRDFAAEHPESGKIYRFID